MSITLHYHTEPGLNDPRIEMSDISGPHEMVLAQQELWLDDQQTSIKVQLKPTAHKLTGGYGQEIGERTVFGVYIQNEDGTRNVHEQTIGGPVRFTVHDPADPQLTRERTALEHIRNRVAMNAGGLILPTPGARESQTELYENTAPGIGLKDAVFCIKQAENLGRLSHEEAVAILGRIHDSAIQALDNFHSTGLIHGHAHLRNFNVDTATGRSSLFDYTLAIQDGQDVATARAEWWGMNDSNSSEDLARFEGRWTETLAANGLTPANSQLDEAEQNKAVAKLERVVALVALWNTTGTPPSDNEIDGYLRARRDLVSDAPTIVYPSAA